MSELLKHLKRQRKTDPENAKKCEKIYHFLSENTGHVWESHWRTLTEVYFTGERPNFTKNYKPSVIGDELVKSLDKN